MPLQVVNGALMQCTMGVAPASLTVLPDNLTKGDSQNKATVMDFRPMVNIASFGMCQSPANPQVAAATAAAMGVLTPMPCVPNTVAPWAPGSSAVTINNFAALLDSDQCNCLCTGVISITNAGQAVIVIE